MGSKPSKPQYQAPQYTELSLPELRTALSKFIDQEKDFGKIQDVISSSATKRMDALEILQPGYKAGLTKAQQVADSLSGGNIPTDVAQKISQSAAFKGLMTGLPGEQRKSVEARDLGLSSMDLMGRGLAAQQNLRVEAQSMMPMQALNFAFTPQAIRSEDVETAKYNNTIKNRQADATANTYNRQQDMNYQYDQQYGGNQWLSPVMSIVGGGLGAAFGGPLGAGLGMNLGGALGGAFNGGRGGGPGGLGMMGVGSSMMGLAGQGAFGNNPWEWGNPSVPMRASPGLRTGMP
ncbi:hypothetical protein EBX31_00865 [bacterium]|nr:hypothetical protein [bacterium]